MHKGLLDGQIGAVRLNPPAIVVIVLAAVNDVIVRIHIDAVAIPILGGGPLTARTAAAALDMISFTYMRSEADLTPYVLAVT